MNDNQKPVYCRNCREQKSFVRYPEKDVKTESDQAYMLGWICKVCGNTTIMSNPDYKPPVALQAHKVSGSILLNKSEEGY